MAEDVRRMRNLGIVGQGGVGKTSLGEALLYVAGATNRLGSVTEGTSNFDFEPEEIRRQLSLSAAFYPVDWKKHRITIVDLPGYANFLADTMNCLRACTGALFVLSPSPGDIKVEAEKVWARARELELPVLGVVTRLDRDPVDYEKALLEFAEVLGARPVPVELPLGTGEEFRGVVDLVRRKAIVTREGGVAEEEIPASLRTKAEEAREKLVETVAEATDELTEKYLEEGTLSEEEIVEALRVGTRARKFVPVFFASGTRAVGIQPLLDAVVELLPSPAERPPARGLDPVLGEEVERQPDPEAPFSALVLKTIVDPFAGRLSVFHVLSGTVSSDSTVLNVNKDSKEHLGQLFRLEGKKQQPVPKAVAGEIVAVAKLKETASGDTLASEKAPIRYPGLVEPAIAISFALEPKSKADEEKASQALQRMMEEDIGLKVHRDPRTHELILSGVGQLHVEVVVEKLKRKYGVEVELKAPKVPYLETIKAKAKAQGRLKKQTGGRGQFADTWIEIEPLPRGKGFEFVSTIVGGAVPKNYIPAVEKGIREAMNEGFLAGYPMVDIKATLFDGSYHEVDSSDMAFKIAASMGFKNACAQAKPVLLEPMMRLEVTVPDECLGDVIGDLNSRRGRVLGVDPKPGGQVIRAIVPMSEVLRYAPDLRSITGGRGSFTMELAGYEEAPPHIAEKVIKEAQAARQEKA
ncbi:MAG: elongation factor G [Candidatus Binatia bacterium]|nr:MAG: elongation factor G [Candidatus Binatia bacterium]